MKSMSTDWQNAQKLAIHFETFTDRCKEIVMSPARETNEEMKNIIDEAILHHFMIKESITEDKMEMRSLLYRLNYASFKEDYKYTKLYIEAEIDDWLKEWKEWPFQVQFQRQYLVTLRDEKKQKKYLLARRQAELGE